MGAGREYFETLHALLAQRMECRGLQVLLAFATLRRLTLKSGYRESQPRWPKGSGDISGQWRDEGRRRGGTRTAAVEVYITRQPPSGDPKTPPKVPRLRPPSPGTGHNGGPPLEDPPQIPKDRPPTEHQRIRVAKALARWMAKAAARRLLGPLGLVVDVVELVEWLNAYYPEIESYFDAPKSLDELRRLASSRQSGYEIHHIVEEASALKDGFPNSIVNGPQNLVRLPKYKHQAITGWFARINEEYGELAPRDYLRGKSWDERFSIGIERMIEEEVLKP